jgi:NTE family protein
VSRSLLSGKKVGLALSSGAARGVAHIGVLEILEKEGIPINMIAGTSMGAIIGAMYAQGKNASEIKEIALDLGWRELARVLALTSPNTGFFSGRKIKTRLKEIIGEVDFADLKIPFACVATDVISGEEVVIKQGPVLEAVIASMSLPVIFRTARWQGRYLVDGGVVNPVPVNVLKDMGADLIIASNAIIKPGDRVQDTQLEEEVPRETGKAKEPNIFHVVMQFVNITSYQAAKSSLRGADVVIKPMMANIGFTDFKKARECIFQGELATQASMPEIKRLLAG